MTTGVSDEELLKTFRAIGEASINNLMLTYLKTESDDYSLNITSRVFPAPTNRDVVFLNQLAVRTCLLHNWSGIQDAYPCLKGFEYVVGDADFLYTIRYPYTDLTTYTTHIVETVGDFVDFTFEFIQSLCIPCLFQFDKSCVSLRKDMNMALDKCRTEKCSETRRLLLDFVTNNMRQPDPASSGSAQLGTSFTQMVPASKQPPKLDLASTWGIGNPFFTQVQPWYNKLPRGKKEKSVSMQKYFPEYPLFAEAVNHLILLKEDGKKPTKFTADGLISQALHKTEDWTFEIDEDDDGKLALVQAWYKSKTVEPDQTQRESFNKDLNNVRESIRNNGELTLLYQLLKQHAETDVPFDCAVKGGFDANGDWHTNFMIYVVRGQLRGNVIHDIIRKTEGTSNKKTATKDKSVTYDYGQKPTDTWAENVRRFEYVDGTAIDFGNNLPAELIKDAATLKTVFFGNGTDFPNEDLFVSALSFLDRDFLLEEKGLLPETLSLMTDFSELRDQLIDIKNTCGLKQNLARAEKVRKTSQILQSEFGTCDIEECIALVPSRTEKVRQKIMNLVHQDIISSTATVLDDKLLSENIGWETFMSFRDAVKNNEAVGVEVTEDDRKKVKIAKDAMDKAVRHRQQES